MADPVITKQELIDAGLDAGSIETFVNGAAGIVTTRTGAQYPNLQSIVQNLGEFAAANQWFVDVSSFVIEDPTSGKFRFDNADPSLVTSIALSADEFSGDDISDYVATWGGSTSAIKGFISVRESAGGSAFAVYSISGVTDNTSWIELTVSYVTGAGSFTDGNATYIAFSRTGDKGADGAVSGDVTGPASSTDSAVAQFDGTTGKLLKNGPTVGTGANQLVQLDGTGALPAVDGSNLTGVGGGVTPYESSEFTADDTADTLSVGTDDGFANDDEVFLKTSGTFPGGLDGDTVYFVVNATANTLQLSLTSGGAVIDITGAGTGTQKIFTLPEIPTTKTDKIKTLDGTHEVSTETIAQGSAKAWAQIDQTGTQSIDVSFNISSLIDEATGVSTYNFTNNFASDSYIPNPASRNPIDTGTGYHGRHTEIWRNNAGKSDASVSLLSYTGSGTQEDQAEQYLSAQGDLA